MLDSMIEKDRLEKMQDIKMMSHLTELEKMRNS
jgi:hypothetical protein